jgi:hypothetical protein
MPSQSSPHVFCIFPYLKTHERFGLRGIEFRNSTDLDDLEAEARDHLSNLCSMFFLGDGVQIREMTCAHFRTGGDAAFQKEMLRTAYETQLLIGYLYSSPHPSGDVFLSSETSSLFVFRPDRVPSSLVWHELGEGEGITLLRESRRTESGFSEGYEGRRNGAAHLWVAEGSHIYPEIPHQTLNLSQSLSDDVDQFLHRSPNWAFRRLYLEDSFQQKPSAVRDRVFSGLEWYLRSCRDAISESEALVHLAIALESLLKVQNGAGLTERFKEAVLTLIGPVPRLDSWLDQFYTARSKAVHEGAPHEIMFFAMDQEQFKKKQQQSSDGRIPHRSLIEYGRRIFCLCLTNLVSAAENADLIALDELFIHNSERVRAIFQIMSQKEKPANNRLHEIEPMVNELREYQGIMNEPYVEFGEVLGAARLMAKIFTSSDPTLDDNAREAINTFQSDACKKTKDSEQLAAMKAIMEALRNIGGTRTGFHEVVIRFLDYATGHAFSLRCMFQERKANEA